MLTKPASYMILNAENVDDLESLKKSIISLGGVAVLSNEEQKMVKGGNPLSCVASKGDVVMRYSTEDGHSELLVARWANVWGGFGYSVTCYPTYYF